jgi:putative molybdopterin biosynthesis protein
MGASCTRLPIVPDNPDRIADALKSAVNNYDLVIISAGSSAGTRDFTAGVIGSLGELIFHGVAVKPGKPVMLGKINGKPVLGLPGYPLAAQTMLREFAAPLLELWGLAPAHRQTIRVKLSRSLDSDPGFDEFVPLFIGRIGEICWGTPRSRGSGVQMATVKANGYVHIPAMMEGLPAGHEIDVCLTTDPGSIERTLILAGTIDPALEELADLIHDQGLFMHASTTGNLGALLALKRNACHAAALSLPDFSLLPECPFLFEHLPPRGLTLIHIATREQGIVSRDALSLDDLTSVRWINTRKDSSTRMVFDMLLKSRKIDPSQVDWYCQEVAGPQAVASAVRNGFADAGISTSGIAHQCGLRFSPVVHERYELAFHQDIAKDPRICTLVSLIKSRKYRKMLEKTGGYGISKTGKLSLLGKDCSVTEMSEPSTS